MTLSGTQVFILYKLFYPIASKYFSLRWKYFILKSSIVFYLIPFAWFKFTVLKKIYKIFPKLETYLSSSTKHIDLTKYILVIQDNKIIPWSIKIIWLIQCFIGIVSVLLVLNQMNKYFKLKKLHLGQIDDSINQMKIFQNIKAILKVKKDVKLVYSSLCDVPYTISFFHPIIVIPFSFKTVDDVDYQFIIEHELNHIKNHDMFFKYMALLAIAVNWYNPICYLVYYELCNVSELYCDFCTTKSYSLELRKRYCNLIVDIATEDKKNTIKKYAVPLVNRDKAIIQRRVLELKKQEDSKKLFLSYLVGGFICTIGSITSFAYNPPVNYYATAASELNAEITFQDTDFQSQIVDLPYDYYWTDINGNEIEIENTNPKIYCPHNYESGTITKHTKYSNNSCKIIYLNGKKCSLCGLTIEGSVINTLRYDICPH